MTEKELAERMERLLTMLDKPEQDEQYRKELKELLDSTLPNTERPKMVTPSDVDDVTKYVWTIPE